MVPRPPGMAMKAAAPTGPSIMTGVRRKAAPSTSFSHSGSSVGRSKERRLLSDEEIDRTGARDEEPHRVEGRRGGRIDVTLGDRAHESGTIGRLKKWTVHPNL